MLLVVPYRSRVLDEDLCLSEGNFLFCNIQVGEDLLDSLGRAAVPVRPGRLWQHLVAVQEDLVLLTEGVACAPHPHILHQSEAKCTISLVIKHTPGGALFHCKVTLYPSESEPGGLEGAFTPWPYKLWQNTTAVSSHLHIHIFHFPIRCSVCVPYLINHVYYIIPNIFSFYLY